VEITGWDTVVFTTTPPREVFVRVVASILARWPAALIEGFEAPPSGPLPLADQPTARLPTGDGHLIFYRDRAMVRHMERVAYAPMADGDGPFAVITRYRRDVVFKVAGLDEHRSAEREPGGIRPPDPYRAWICTPELVEVTAVTPDDPESQPFAAWVLSEVKRACSGLA
jgi:hypothetical protein